MPARDDRPTSTTPAGRSLWRPARGRFVLLVASLLLVASGVAAATVALTGVVGRQEDGSVILPTGQRLTPAGAQVEFPGRPMAVALRPDGKTAAVLNATRSSLVVVDLDSGAVKQTFNPGGNSASFAGLVYSEDGGTLYASQANGALVIADVAPDGNLSLDQRVTIPTPGGLALSDDGGKLYIALNRRNALGVFDLATRTISSEIPVGNAPHGVVLAGGKAYVTNQGGRRAEAGDTTNLSDGTAIVSDPKSGSAATGTVSVVDLAAGSTKATIEVGLHPTATLVHGRYLFVANTNSDSVSVIDTNSDAVVKSFGVEVFQGAPFGSSPNAIGLLDEHRLLVSLGRNNALGVYRWDGPSEPVRFEGLIPTGGYPASVAVDTAANRYVVANNTGVGAPDSPTVGDNIGSVSIVPIPRPDEMSAYTSAVFANNDWKKLGSGSSRARPGVAPVPVPERIGEPSKIKHVFYVVKENRTYDQVLGDDQRGNGDTAFTMFGRPVTPNHHALADEFGLLDNTYVSGRLSADGHQWVTQAFVDDYLEKAFGGFVRSYPFNGGDSLAYSPTGFLWDNALRNRRSVRAYGEYANELRGPSDRFGKWVDWYRDAKIMRGTESGSPHVPPGTFQTHSDVPSLDKLLNRDYPPYTNAIPDVYRAEVFMRDMRRYERSGDMPSLVTIQLNTDHTSGSAPNLPTPRAQVADNDLALGRIVETISKSRFWKSSAIFVIEDDTQAGLDHVDGHRTPAYVISPYSKRRAVNSTFYTQIDMVRTIEQILGLPPMNQMDLAATPMRGVFTDSRDDDPYEALPNEIALDELNPGSAPVAGRASTPFTSEAQREWARASAAMGFDDPNTVPDENDENVLNRAIWYATKGFKRPYPGDGKVLLPHEVPRAAGESPQEEAEERAEG